MELNNEKIYHKYDPSEESEEFRGYPLIAFKKRPEILKALEGKEETDFFFKYLERCFSFIELFNDRLIVRYYELTNELTRRGIEAWMDEFKNSDALPQWEVYYLILDRTGTIVEYAAKLRELYPSEIKDITPDDEGKVIVKREIFFNFVIECSPIINLEGVNILEEVRGTFKDFLAPIENTEIQRFNPLIRDNGTKE